MAYPQLVQRTEEVDQSSLKSLVCERFGIADAVFENLVFFRSNSRLVSIVNKDHVPVEGLVPERRAAQALRRVPCRG